MDRDLSKKRTAKKDVKTADLVEQPTATSDRVKRDSFTMPSSDYDLIDQLRKRCLKAGVSVTKSAIVRAGLNALRDMPDKRLLDVVNSLTETKAGRPKVKTKNKT